LALVPTAVAGSEFVGDWEVKQEFRGQERVSTISIKEGDDGLSGSWISQRGTAELSDVKETDGTLSFVRKMERQGQSFEFTCEASIVDGNLMGTMMTPRGDREFKGIAASAEPTFIGSWDVTLDFQGREVPVTLSVTEEDGKLGGVWSSERGDAEIEDAKIEDGTLSFVRNMERDGQEFLLEFTAKIEGEKLIGEMITPMGEMPFTGTMAKADAGAEDDSEEGRAKAMLDQIDGNGDGKVTEDEAPEQMKQFFTMIDADGSGGIDANEMIMVIQFMDQQ
jgi:hypothetical protein